LCGNAIPKRILWKRSSKCPDDGFLIFASAWALS
jgi:hypothetical protein